MDFYKPRELRGKTIQKIIRTRQIVGIVVRYPVGLFIPCLNEEGHIETGRLASMGAPSEVINWLMEQIEK